MFKDIVQKIKAADVVGRFIYANVIVYVFVLLIALFSVLFNLGGSADVVVRYLELPASLPLLMQRPWSFVTYMFLHENFMHILWNMVALYFFGRIFKQGAGPHRHHCVQPLLATFTRHAERAGI